MASGDLFDAFVVEQIESIVDRVCAAQARDTEAAINANACGTAVDYAHARDMECALLEAREEAVEALCRLVAEERRTG